MRIGRTTAEISPRHRRTLSIFLVLLLAFAPLVGCAIRLAPSYDAVIVAGLTKANEQAMTLFAGVSTGAISGNFAQREPLYNETIGTLDATRLLAEARPNPPTVKAQLLKVKRTERDAGSTKDELLISPSPDILESLVEAITQMREADRRGSLSANAVVGVKQFFEVGMDQVLTYEKALQR